MKKCFKCHEVKPLSCFYKHRIMKDGHLGKCKCCTKQDVARHRCDNISKIKAYDKARANNPNRVAGRKSYAEKLQSTTEGRKKLLGYKAKYRERNPIKRKAMGVVNNAVKRGKLDKNPCEICGSEKRIHGHHDDYSKPLEVRWLCPAHHWQWHKENGSGLNG